jgi:hypothetical protein
MANQMIALQARNPQLPDPARQTAQYANMMNMARQQEAAQRQAALAQQTMDINQAREKRDVEKFSMDQSTALVSALGTGLIGILRDPSDASLGQAAQTFASVGMDPEKFGGVLSQIQGISDPNDRKLFALQFIAQSEPARAALKFVMPDVKETQIGDDTVFTDNNANSPTFGQELFRLNVAPERAKFTSEVVDNRLFNVNPFTGVAAEATIGDPNQDLTPPPRTPTLISSGVRSPYAVGGGVGAGQPTITPPVAPQGITPPAPAVGGPRGGPSVGTAGRGNTADVVYGFGEYGSPSKPISQSTIGEVQKFQRQLINNTRGAIGKGPNIGTGAVGTYQFTYGTLQEYAPKVLGPNWRNKTFTPDVQEQLAKALYNDRKSGNLKDTWAGLPNNRPGQYTNVPWEQVRDKIIQVESAGGPRRNVATRTGAGTPAGAGTGTPVTVSEAVKLPGKRRVSSLVADMLKEYDKLNRAKAIGSSERGVAENIFDYLSVSAPGQEIQKMFGTKANDSLANIASSRKLLASAMAAAMGLSSKQADSNTELQLTLASLSDATQGYQAVTDILKRVDREYGMGTASSRTPTTGGAGGKDRPSLDSFRRKK